MYFLLKIGIFNYCYVGLSEGTFVDDHKFDFGGAFFHLQVAGFVMRCFFFWGGNFVSQDSS